ncbi:MAG: hypothetical protein PHC51_11040 [bacterium]|nr:hypothetical protein [bacterium]
MGKINFTIEKPFGHLQLIPHANGLQMKFLPNINGELDENGLGSCSVMIPIEYVGGLWATSRAFLYAVESLDVNVIISAQDGDTLVKLYRDKPKGAGGSLTGEEVSWLRIVTGRSEEERRRIKLGPRDLLCLELACNSVLVLSASPIYNTAGA